MDATNPYNPFGFTLDGNSPDFGLGRRPIEGGPRIFSQTVDTKYYATGVNGDWNFGDHQWFWDLNYVDSTNRAPKKNSQISGAAPVSLQRDPPPA